MSVMPRIHKTLANDLTEARRGAVANFYGALATKNFGLVDLALTKHWEDIPLAPGQEPGPEGIKAIFSMLVEAFPDISLEIVDALSEGNRAAVRVACVGTHEGQLFGVPPSGRVIRFNLHEFHEFDGDKISKTWHMEDLFGLFAQIGAFPQLPGEAA
jgi:predicted ester cyclase